MQKKQITRLRNPTLETKAPDGEYYQKPGATQGNLLETLRNDKRTWNPSWHILIESQLSNTQTSGKDVRFIQHTMDLLTGSKH